MQCYCLGCGQVSLPIMPWVVPNGKKNNQTCCMSTWCWNKSKSCTTVCMLMLLMLLLQRSTVIYANDGTIHIKEILPLICFSRANIEIFSFLCIFETDDAMMRQSECPPPFTLAAQAVKWTEERMNQCHRTVKVSHLHSVVEQQNFCLFLKSVYKDYILSAALQQGMVAQHC